MAYKVRVIARLDIKGPNLIKGIQFEGNRVLGTADSFAENYYREGIDELIYQDAVASLYRRNSLTHFIERTASRIFIPLTVAGGIRTVDDVRTVLRAGADKVAINTGAVDEPQLIKRAAEQFGSQCIVSSIEAYRDGLGSARVWVDYGREPTSIDAIEWAQKVVELGAGEILFTSVNNDGTGRGYDLTLLKQISAAVPVPVIASGGAGTPLDVVAAIQEGGASAVAVASLFHYHYARPVNRVTMTFDERKLRMGRDIDSGNVEFLNHGYGGQRATCVTPCAIGDVKIALRHAGIECRGA
jgi:imidazole glycerol-phosphate synthase subunit HisF